MRARWLLLIAGLTIGYALRGWIEPNRQAVAETVVRTVTDTVYCTQPEVRDSIIIRYIAQRLPVAVEQQQQPQPSADSVEVSIPIEQRRYDGEDYRAWVSGYQPRLDSIQVCSRTSYVTERIALPATPKRWHIGVTAGYGATPAGAQPYIGIGLTYSIFSF